MARKFIDAESMASNITTRWIDLQRRRHVGITLLVTSGTPTGTFSVRCANKDDKSDEVAYPTAAIDSGAPTNPAASAPQQAIILDKVHTRWVGISYTATSGAGTLDGYWSVKDS